jgi:hypothetical protein
MRLFWQRSISRVRNWITELAEHIRELDASHAALLLWLWMNAFNFPRKKLTLMTAIQIKLVSLTWLLFLSLQWRHTLNRTYLANNNFVNVTDYSLLVRIFSRAVNKMYRRWILLSQNKYIFYTCMHCGINEYGLESWHKYRQSITHQKMEDRRRCIHTRIIYIYIYIAISYKDR